MGALIEGKRAACAMVRNISCSPGDLIVIPPHAPHSCNPLHDRPRSYHMLYLEAAWCNAQRPDIPLAPVSPRRSHCCATALSLPVSSRLSP
ncbi:AraC family ligand binding domain-containing protein [Klebsiella variicola subsp. variicola]|nr:AraC family ligand binding domain-containing protein [Klebsiella variicola subsp. variicola]